MTTVSQQRKNLKKRGLTWEQKCWLVYSHQDSKCSFCGEPITVETSVIDHDHYAPCAKTHKGNDSCIGCLRAAVHPVCNSPVIMVLEKCPHLQNDFIREYLKHRPFCPSNGTPETKGDEHAPNSL